MKLNSSVHREVNIDGQDCVVNHCANREIYMEGMGGLLGSPCRRDWLK